MILQQVNLFQDELKSKKLKYSALMMIQLSFTLIVIFSAVMAFKYTQLQFRQGNLAEQQQKQKIVLADLQKIQSELAKRQKDPTLAIKILKRSKELANKQKVVGILSQDEFGSTKGFVEHFIGLARQRIEGLWLTKIRIADGGTNIALHGTTIKAALLPQYLQKLSSEKVFVGAEFQSLYMERQKKKKNWLNFSLQNKKIESLEP